MFVPFLPYIMALPMTGLQQELGSAGGGGPRAAAAKGAADGGGN